MTPQKIKAFFGGAFDPVHFGHIKPALELASQAQIDTIRFVPCGEHPYAKPMVSAEHRLHMLKLVENKPAIIIDRRAIDDEALLYTVDLMSYFRESLGADTPLAFVLGLDNYLDMERWKNADKLKALTHFIVLGRHLEEPQKTAAAKNTAYHAAASLDELMTAPGGMVYFFNNKHYEISSTRVRETLCAGEDPRYLLPGVVFNYIRRNKLYAESERANRMADEK